MTRTYYAHFKLVLLPGPLITNSQARTFLNEALCWNTHLVKLTMKMHHPDTRRRNAVGQSEENEMIRSSVTGLNHLPHTDQDVGERVCPFH